MLRGAVARLVRHHRRLRWRGRVSLSPRRSGVQHDALVRRHQLGGGHEARLQRQRRLRPEHVPELQPLRAARRPPAGPPAARTPTAPPPPSAAPRSVTPAASVNLAGNGDLETGTVAGWSPANGGGAIALSSVASSGVSNSGAYSIVGTNRTMPYHGPAYALPTGPGKYIISAWGLQRDLTTHPRRPAGAVVLPGHEPGLLPPRPVRHRDAPEHVDVVQRHHRHHPGGAASTACRRVRRRAW